MLGLDTQMQLLISFMTNIGHSDLYLQYNQIIFISPRTDLIEFDTCMHLSKFLNFILIHAHELLGVL